MEVRWETERTHCGLRKTVGYLVLMVSVLLDPLNPPDYKSKKVKHKIRSVQDKTNNKSSVDPLGDNIDQTFILMLYHSR